MSTVGLQTLLLYVPEAMPGQRALTRAPSRICKL